MFGACAKCTQGPAGQIEWAVSVGGWAGWEGSGRGGKSGKRSLKGGLASWAGVKGSHGHVCGARCCRPMEADCAHEFSDLTLAV